MKYFFNMAVGALLIGLASCSAPKKVPYVVEAETIPQEVLSEVSTITDPILGPGDLLNIDVTASNMVSVAPFNKGMYVSENGQIERISNNNNNSSGSSTNANTAYYLVSPNGTIDFPSIGIIDVTGKTKTQLAQYITDQIYPKYIKERPKVEVRLMNFRVVVTGAVGSPGIYQSPNERMNFFEALAMAGDLSIRGERTNIMLIRTNADGTREVHRLDINDKNFLLSPYFTLQQNDIIYVVPNSAMRHGSWQINPVVTAILTYVGGLSSVVGLVINIITLSKQ